MNNYQIPSTNNQIIINDQIPIAKYYLVIVKLEFIWNLGFGYWNLSN